jgi:hypothetical protein
MCYPLGKPSIPRATLEPAVGDCRAHNNKAKVPRRQGVPACSWTRHRGVMELNGAFQLPCQSARSPDNTTHYSRATLNSSLLHPVGLPAKQRRLCLLASVVPPSSGEVGAAQVERPQRPSSVRGRSDGSAGWTAARTAQSRDAADRTRKLRACSQRRGQIGVHDVDHLDAADGTVLNAWTQAPTRSLHQSRFKRGAGKRHRLKCLPFQSAPGSPGLLMTHPLRGPTATGPPVAPTMTSAFDPEHSAQTASRSTDRTKIAALLGLGPALKGFAGIPQEIGWLC